MRFALYCRELRASGGRAVGIGLLRALAGSAHSHDITAFVREDPEYMKLRDGGIRLVTLRGAGGAGAVLAHRRFRAHLESDRHDAVYMMGNAALVGAPCPQAVYFHQSWALYPDSPAWRRLPPLDRAYYALRNTAFARALPHAQAVSAQTPVVLERLHRYIGIPYERLALVPNAVSPSSGMSDGDTESSRRMLESGHRIRALCLARHMAHKNLDILPEVADRLIATNRTDIGIFVTVDASHGPGARRLMRQMNERGREAVLHNLGEVPMAEVGSCYRAADALLLPTLLESFSGTYVDAMQASVPVITSDLDFAHTVCGDAAIYVDPLRASDIAAALLTLDSDRIGWQSRTALGKERVATVFMDWDAVAERVIDLLVCVARGQSIRHLLDHPWVRETIDLDRLAGAGAASD